MTQGSQTQDTERNGGELSVSTGRTDRDLQRSALRELVALATGCAATEAEVEAHRQRETADAEQELIHADTTLAERHDELRRQVQEKYDQRLSEALAQFDFEARGIKESFEQARSRVAGEFETAEQEVRQKLDQAVWLAESVFEAAQIQVRKDTGKAEEEYKQHLEQLGEMDAKAYDLVRLYGHEGAIPPDAAEEDADAKLKPPAPEHADEALNEKRHTIQVLLERLHRLQIPRLFVGARPYFIALLVMVGAVVVARLVKGPPITTPADITNAQLPWRAIGYAAGGAAAALIVLGVALWFVGRSHVRGVFVPLQHALAEARLAAKARYQHQARTQDLQYSHALKKRDAEVRAAKDQAAPQQTKVSRTRDASLRVATGERDRQMERIQSRLDRTRAEMNEWRGKSFADLQHRYEHDLDAAKRRYEERLANAERDHATGRMTLEQRWQEGLKRIQAPIRATGTDGKPSDDGRGACPSDWSEAAWTNWTPPSTFCSTIPFGRLQVDLKQIAESAPNRDAATSRLELPRTFSLPALLAFPRQSSLLIQADRNGRESAIRTLQMVMTRLLTNLPPGRVRFTIIDPVGLGQNFAGFMHLADHDENLVGGRIWTNPEHIDQRLTDLTEHMETVIQKYLRNEFETIDDYNAQAGELAEPYRFLVIADFPISFSGDAIQKLNSIASTGARCGVYTLIARDLRAPVPAGSHVDEVVANSINLVQEADRFIWKDEVFEQFPLAVDSPPPEDALTRILTVVGHYAKDANRVEVPFDSIAPKPEQFWSGDCTGELRVPIGRMGATRSQLLRLGKGVAQHALIAGKTGSGKSTLLHVLVTNLALWYHPDEVEFYLVDFKKGVEFKTYATHGLPHARAIAVESDREFGLSVLQRLDGELTRRGELYRKLGVQDLAAYRETSGQKMPRTLLIIDEFQEFFSEDDKLAQDAGLLLDRLVRQGRAFGIHVLLGSQTIGGSSGLARSTIGQMAVRVALQTSEADSQLILGDNNSAARLLSRPGEAIYNDQGGLVEGNSPFQVSWLADEQREGFLDQVQRRAASDDRVHASEPIVFEGNAPADVAKNRKLAALLESSVRDGAATGAPLAWIGEPVAIKEPTGLAMRRQSGANVIVIGQQEEPSMAVLVCAMISIAAQQAPAQARFVVLDGTPADSPLAGTFARLRDALPHEVKLVEFRDVESAIHELADEVERRQSAQGSDPHPPAVYVFIYGLQRYRALRKSEESAGLGFSLDRDESQEKKRAPVDRRFADLLREGPPLGVHLIAWADTPAAVERTFERASMREFDHRILFQMSANDSSNLIDSPAANKLGFHRALAYSEEQGVMEKFRPYALPGHDWFQRVRDALSQTT
jgi:hypothetical protein